MPESLHHLENAEPRNGLLDRCRNDVDDLDESFALHAREHGVNENLDRDQMLGAGLAELVRRRLVVSPSWLHKHCGSASLRARKEITEPLVKAPRLRFIFPR